MVTLVKLVIAQRNKSKGCPEIQKPSISFSKSRHSIWDQGSHWGTSGSSNPSSPSAVSNNDVCEHKAFSFVFAPYFISLSKKMLSLPCEEKKYWALCMFSKQSNAPDFTKASIQRRLIALRFILVMKSKGLLNTPFASLSLIISSAAVLPTPFMAASPKRISPFLFTMKFKSDSFTLGPKTFMPSFLHSSV